MVRGGYSVGMPGLVPGLGGLSPCLFRSEVCHFVVVVVVVVVVVNVVVGVIVFVGVNVVVVAFPVVDWGSATVAASAWRHRGMAAVLAGV